MKLDLTNLSENYYSKIKGSKEYTWDVPVLLQHVREQKYKIFNLLIDGINFNVLPWDIENMYDILKHVNRTNKVDSSKPILLDDEGTICDGWHRILKAASQGKKYIKAIRIEEMPKSSSITEIRN